MSEEQQPQQDHAIGKLNGPWSFLFRVQIALGTFLIPYIVGHSVWIIGSIQELKTDSAVRNQRWESLRESHPVSQSEFKEQIREESDRRYVSVWFFDNLAGRVSKLEK